MLRFRPSAVGRDPQLNRRNMAADGNRAPKQNTPLRPQCRRREARHCLHNQPSLARINKKTNYGETIKGATSKWKHLMDDNERSFFIELDMIIYRPYPTPAHKNQEDFAARRSTRNSQPQSSPNQTMGRHTRQTGRLPFRGSYPFAYSGQRRLFIFPSSLGEEV